MKNILAAVVRAERRSALLALSEPQGVRQNDPLQTRLDEILAEKRGFLPEFV